MSRVKYPSKNWALIDSRMKGEVVQVEEKRTKNPAAIQNISLKVISRSGLAIFGFKAGITH